MGAQYGVELGYLFLGTQVVPHVFVLNMLWFKRIFKFSSVEGRALAENGGGCCIKIQLAGRQYTENGGECKEYELNTE